ncbi:hypothetical protein RSAG8_10110, partial [Rhizoctonia solani AG-8 WAC10335]
MPHVILYLRGLEHANQQQMQLNKERLRNTLEELEAVQAKIDACGQFTRKLRRLMSAIIPGSDKLHDLNALQVRVKEILNVYRDMEKVFGKGVMPASSEQHYYRGVAVIIAQRIY